jgi:hypothetical protein
MMVTGSEIKEAINRWKLTLEMVEKRFKPSLMVFPGDEKDHPDELALQIMTAEYAIARLQYAQTLYNNHVTVEVEGAKMSLAEAVRLVGSAGRMSKRWREAIVEERDRFGPRDDLTRKADEIYAQRVLAAEEVTKRAKRALKRASALRNAIGGGNNTSVAAADIQLDPSLLAE